MIAIIGINHETASVDIREAFSFQPAEIIDFLKKLKSSHTIEGGIILSTCNRMEIVYETRQPEHDNYAEMARLLMEYKQQSLDKIKHLYHLERDKAILHVFSMASGLKSMVRGETQILGQLKEVVVLSRSAGLLTPVLMRLFDKTYEVAKKVRSSYSISFAQTSAGAAAVNLLHEKYGEELQKGVSLILGAGQMAASVVEALKHHGIKNIMVYNRTQERALRFANKHHLKKYYYEDSLSYSIQQAKWVWVTTGASSPILNKSILSKIDLKEEQIIFDIAVPRNVDIDVLELDSIRLYGIDDLRQGDPEEIDQRFPSSKEVRTLFETSLEEFKIWKEGLALRDVYIAISEEVNAHLKKELGFISDQNTEFEKELIEEHCTHLANGISNSLIKKLRETSEQTKNPVYAEAIRKLLMS